MNRAKPLVCEWCGRRLGDEYYFRCPECGKAYCWIHQSRHAEHIFTCRLGF
ncbi:MAG: hypothetical protein QXL21_08085 [Nitrososphaerales archaeon]